MTDPNYANQVRQVRRLGRLMFLLTVMLCVVLLFYAWPMVKGWFWGPSGTPRPVTPRGELMQVEKTTIDIFQTRSPSVVFITTEARMVDRWSRRVTEVPQGSGSGFIWDENGDVVTNFHVVQNASTAHVILQDQTVYTARLVGASADHDLAVLKIDVPLGVRLQPVPIGRSSDLKVGQAVFAIGNPFGLDQTLTTGVVSALRRSITGESGRPIEDVIQTDAAINPGNSGGPLLDSSGLLIGVNTAIFAPTGAWSGIGFAIPVDTVNRVVPQIIAKGQYTRGKLGVAFDDQSSQMVLTPRKVSGLAIRAVLPDSPAAKAGLTGVLRGPGGLMPGDVIQKVNDREIKAAADLYLAMDRVSPGEDVRLLVWRDGQTREVVIRAGE